MAEINTGLGWAAQSDWLLQADNYELAKIGDYTGLCGPLNVGTTQSQVWQLGQTIAVDSSNIVTKATSYNTNGDVYVAASSSVGYWFISLSPNTTVYAIRFYSNGRVYVDLGRVDLNQQYTRLDGTRFYYRFWSANWGTIDSAIPVYSDIASACNAFVFSGATFTKTNTGFAVACVAQWKTQNNVIIKTPVLISSETDYTDMSTDGSGISLAKLNILRQGMRFYMSFYDMAGDNIVSTTLPILDLTEEAPKTLEQVFAYIADLSHAAILVLDAPDPYQEEAEESTEEGGGGEELEDDPVEEQTMPIPNAAQFCTIYVPTSQELGQMASYLWSGAFDVTQVIKLFSNPMDSILGLSAVPVDLVGVDPPDQIYLGGVALPNVTMHRYAGRTAVPVDCGTVTVAERWGSYLDYAPYTDFSIYLPFIGIKTIKADDIMGKTISLKYNIDILSGGCVAYLRPVGGSVLYEWSGQCSLQIPVTGRSYDNVFQSAMSVATAAFAAVTAPASAPVLSGAVASAAVQAAASKPHIERSGMVNGITGFLGQLRPYLIRTIPEAFIPADQNKFIGYPAYINVDLANVKGYNEVDSIHLENVTATGAELDEIETILKGGAIF